MAGDVVTRNPLLTIRTVLLVLLLLLGQPVALFVSAGRLDWWQGWLLLAVTIGMGIISRLAVARRNPDLIGERARFTDSAGIKTWDRVLVPLIGIWCPLLIYVTAGLDERFSWSAELTVPVALAAFVILCLGYAFNIWAMLINRYFSSVVRIQADRGQSVVRSGPYRYVRHPGYAGAVLAIWMIPLLLGSWWAYVPTALITGLYILRTALEDRTLQAELPGYIDYTRQVRFRLLPGIW